MDFITNRSMYDTLPQVQNCTRKTKIAENLASEGSLK